MKKVAALVRSNKHVIVSLVGILVASIIFYLRVPIAFDMPNFYAEDGSTFLRNILEYGPLLGPVQPFNGYLVVGQYLLVDVAYIAYFLFDLSFYTLPKLLAVVSYIFLGLTAMLPYILFRKQMGTISTLLTAVFVCFVPLPAADYAVVGTIGNLKFLFMYWALLFVVYRNLNYKELHKTIIADVVLLLCVLTNGPTIALLPLIGLPYVPAFKRAMKKRQYAQIFQNKTLVGAFVVCVLAAAYVTTVVLNGIPKLPGYLDEPYINDATVKLMYASTLKAWIYPFYQHLSDMSVVLSGLAVTGLVYRFGKARRLEFTMGIYAIFIASVSFVATRPGVSHYMTEYTSLMPDQFFYAQTIIFIFICCWVVSPYIKTNYAKYWAVGISAVYLLLAAPYGISDGTYKQMYLGIGSAYDNTQRLCAVSNSTVVKLPIYPNDKWFYKVDKEDACSE